jgi:hypothetical protein
MSKIPAKLTLANIGNGGLMELADEEIRKICLSIAELAGIMPRKR